MPAMDKNNKQGGKQYGELLAKRAEGIDKINNELVDDTRFKDIEDLREKLESFKVKFIEIDEDNTGEIDLMNLKRMLEKLGQPKTHLELQKMIRQVDTTNSGTINYTEFVDMMIGTRTSVLKMILMFEEKKKEKEKPTGPPPQKSLDQLP